MAKIESGKSERLTNNGGGPRRLARTTANRALSAKVNGLSGLPVTDAEISAVESFLGLYAATILKNNECRDGERK